MKLCRFIPACILRYYYIHALLIFSFSALSQEDNFWYFGNQAGLNFSSGSPIPLTNGALVTLDNTSTISDSAGNLLFYTNGETVWNKNHAIIPNGSGLLGNVSGGQSALIVPQPGTSLYYIFTTDGFAGPNGFRYSIVDMTLNGGLGDIISKNNLLFSPPTEKIDGVYNCADNSYWVLTHEWNSDQFNAYKLSSSGLDTVPVKSNVGSIHSGGSPYGYNAVGQLTFSRNAKKAALGIYSLGNIEIFDFDINTGIVSNPIIITGYPKLFGLAFSPDGNRLYVTQWYTKDIIQFDLSSGNQSIIAASAAIIGIVNGPGSYGYYAGYMQLGPDDKIYAAVYDDTYLAIINNPNAAGTSCNFVDNGVYLGGKTSRAGLSRVVKINSISHSITSQNFCFGDQTIFSLSDTNDVISCNWNFGDTSSGILNTSSLFNPVHSFSAPGNYSIQAVVPGNCNSDTITETIAIHPLPAITITGNATACAGSTVSLTGSGGIIYQWSNGDNDSATTVMNDGTYYLTVINSENCIAVDSSSVSFNPTANILKNLTICEGDSIFLQGTYQSQPGTYYDTLLTVYSCDSIIVTSLIVTILYDTAAVAICTGDSFFVQDAYQGAPGIYFDTLNSAGSCDSIIVTILTVNNALYDTAAALICAGDSLFVQGAYQSDPGIYFDTLNFTGSCDSIIVTILTVNNALYDTTRAVICAGDSLFVQGSYQSTAGIYSDTLNSAGNCDSIIVTILTVAPPAVSNQQLSICKGDSVFIGGKWQTLDGIYFDTLSSMNGCDSIIATNLTVITTVSDFTFNLYPCTYSIQFSNLSLGTNSYFWNFGDGFSDTSANPIHPYSEAANYFVSLISNSSGCFDTSARTIIIDTLPVADFTYSSSCDLSANFAALKNNYSASWSFGDGNKDTVSNPSHLYGQPGIFGVTLIVSDSSGCTDTVTKNIVIQNSMAAFSFIIQECSSEILFIDSSINATSHRWNFGDGKIDTVLNPHHTYQNPSEYVVTLLINDGTLCYDSVSHTVNVQENNSAFYIPNAFTPNSDGLNDLFEIKEMNNCSSYQLMIFDRWGELIFKSEDGKNFWDGTYNGTLVQHGVYAYIIKINEFIKTGHIAVLK